MSWKPSVMTRDQSAIPMIEAGAELKWCTSSRAHSCQQMRPERTRHSSEDATSSCSSCLLIAGICQSVLLRQQNICIMHET